MKKLILFISLFIIMLNFSSCEKRYSSTDEIIEIIRNESEFTSAETADITYAGSCLKENKILLWYVMGNDLYNLQYIPVNCYITMEEEYIFNNIYSPMDRGDNIAVLQWCGGYSFLVNNPECVQIRIRNGAEIREIPVTQYPFVYYNDIIPNEYDFLDKDGNVLTH